MAGCSPVFWKWGEHRHSMTGESTSPSTICPRTCSFRVCTRRDLPRPASPTSNTTWPMPSFACSQRSFRRLTSVSRPVNGATRAIVAISSSTAPLGSGNGPDGDENLDDSFPSSGIYSRTFWNYGEPPVLIDHRHIDSAYILMSMRQQTRRNGLRAGGTVVETDSGISTLECQRNLSPDYFPLGR